MPLIRKPVESVPAPKLDVRDVLEALKSTDTDRRWAAARDAGAVAAGSAALAAALWTEKDPRVREAMFTSLARIGTPESVDAVIGMLRTDDANLRTGALDALHLMAAKVHDLIPRLLDDRDVDVRILSCELARSLASAEAASLMCGVLDREPVANVCAAAVDVLAEVGGADALPSLRRCALRFRDSPFLEFSINVVIDRLGSPLAPPRA